MSDPFDAPAAYAVDAGFTLFGRAATYTAPGGSPVACTIMLDGRDPGQRLDDGRPVVGTVLIEVRASEIAAPATGGVFTVGTASYTVSNRPERRDERGLVWKMWAE